MSLSVLSPQKRPVPAWIARIEYLFRPYEHVTEEEAKAGKLPRYRFAPNAIELWGLQALLFAAVALLLPKFWHSQLRSGLLVFLLTFLALQFFVISPAEWFFHRFGMHRLLTFRLMPWLKIRPEEGAKGIVRAWRRMSNTLTIASVYYIARMAFEHGAHHKITDVTPVNPDRLSELFSAINHYEITTNVQTENAVFPHFSSVGFWIGFLPLFFVMQIGADALGRIPALHLAHLPIILAYTLGITWQVWVYESSHAIMHKPYLQWWKPRIELPVVGRWYSMVYRFHFFHHMNEGCSLGIVGSIWFLYFWDWVFGTYKLARLELIEAASKLNPDVLELHADEIKILPGARPEDFTAPPKQRRFIAFLDRHAVDAKEMWNKIFVAALQEVRQRQRRSHAQPS